MKAKLRGRYQNVASAAVFSAFMILLLSACSTPTAVDPTASVPTAADPAPAQTVQASPTMAEPTQQPTLAEDTATPPPPTPAVTATAELTIGSSRTSEIDGMVQMYVPAGPFLMGSTDPEAIKPPGEGRAYPEVPQHTVTLEGYWIDKFEVTNSQFTQCVEAGACEPPWANKAYKTYLHYYDNPEFANYPVVWVTWYQAKNYCEWAGRRLLTEAEWEKAARGTEGQKYPWGNDPVTDERVNLCDVNCPRDVFNPAFNDGYPETAPVGSFPAGASPYGVMDMEGNVWEWVSTLIQPYPYDATDGREDLEAPGERAWRGASWNNGYWWLRSSVRYRSVPEYKWYVLGIRCAATE